MNPYLMIVIGNNAGIYPFYLLILLVASIALIRVNDWYRNIEAREREVILGELEALFALEDRRETRRNRS